MANMFDRKFVSDSLFSYSSQCGTAACALLFTLLATRYFGVAVFGALSILAALSRVLSSIISVRTNEAVVAFYLRGENNGEFPVSKFALLAGALMDAVVGLILFLAVFLGAGFIAAHFLKNINETAQVRLYAGVLFLMFLRGTPLGYLQATECMKSISTLNLTESVGKVLTAGYFIVAGRALDLHHLVLAVFLSAALVSMAAYSILIVALVHRLRGVSTALNKPLMREFARFTGKTFASTTLKAGNQNIDTLVLGYLSNPHTAGVYGIFRQFLAPLPFLSAPLTTLIYPKFVKSVIQEKKFEVKSAVHTVNRKLARVYSVALVAIIPGLFIYTRWIGLTLKPVEWYAFGMMIPTSFVVGRFWWARPFSNAVDPSISLRFNFYATMFCLLTIYPLTVFFGIAGTSLCMLGAAFLLHVNWGMTLRRFAT